MQIELVATDMEVNCAGCAGCCFDWRDVRPVDSSGTSSGDSVDETEDGSRSERRLGHERRGSYTPLDDTYNFVSLDREEIRRFLDSGLGDALTPRLWVTERAESDTETADGSTVEIDGRSVAAIRGRPAFFVGLRQARKPIAPFGREEPLWLPTCVFLDPTTLQCRIHDDDRYPSECGEYPAHNLSLDVETECERVESVFGGDRLLDATVQEDEEFGDPLLGPQAIGTKVFAHPRPADLEGSIERLDSGSLTPADRAEFVAVAAASSPGTVSISEPHYRDARDRVLEADSWVGNSIADWDRRSSDETTRPSPSLAASVEVPRGAPETPGWEDIDG